MPRNVEQCGEIVGHKPGGSPADWLDVVSVLLYLG